MKKHLLTLAVLASFCALFFTACQQGEENQRLEVNLEEVGHHNSKVVNAGSDLHVEATVLAEALSSNVLVSIRQKNGTAGEQKRYDDEKYIGVKNFTFHEHIDIRKDMPAGEYILVLTVTDKKGQVAMAQSELTIKPFDPNAVDDDDHHEE